jgi:hypothetical protein
MYSTVYCTGTGTCLIYLKIWVFLPYSVWYIVHRYSIEVPVFISVVDFCCIETDGKILKACNLINESWIQAATKEDWLTHIHDHIHKLFKKIYAKSKASYSSYHGLQSTPRAIRYNGFKSQVNAFMHARFRQKWMASLKMTILKFMASHASLQFGGHQITKNKNIYFVYSLDFNTLKDRANLQFSSYFLLYPKDSISFCRIKGTVNDIFVRRRLFDKSCIPPIL